MQRTSVYFATNRDVTEGPNGPSFGNRFNALGPQFFRVGTARVWKNDSTDPDECYSVDDVLLAPEPTDRPQPASLELFNSLRSQMVGSDSDVLVYLHGFANDFPHALMRGAQLADAYGLDGGGNIPLIPFVFSWPSDGRVAPPWKYHSDRDDAEASGKAMARAVLRLLDFLSSIDAAMRCGHRIHLVAHSMGNWALRHALQGLRSLVGDGNLRVAFDTAFLMAADEDADALSPGMDHKLALLPRIARRIYVYHNHEDSALAISASTKLNPTRLGTDGPTTFSGLPTTVLGVDCQKVAGTKLSHGGHQYYRLRPEVVKHVQWVLAGGRPEKANMVEVVEPGRRVMLL